MTGHDRWAQRSELRLRREPRGGRRGQLPAALKALGLTAPRFLGGFGRYSDSGMAWHEDGHAIA